MHLTEGASGVPSGVGMAKTGRCGGGGEGGCGCPGRSNVRAEATGWEARQNLKEKRSCASPQRGKRGAFTCSGRGGPVRPSRCLSSTSSPPSPAQPNLMLPPAPQPHWLNSTATHQRRKDAKQRKGRD